MRRNDRRPIALVRIVGAVKGESSYLKRTQMGGTCLLREFGTAVCLVLVLLLPLSPAAVAAQLPAGETATLSLAGQQGTKVELDYRTAPDVTVARAAVMSDGVTLPIVHSAAYPWNGAVTAVLILVDTSESRRPATMRQNLSDIARIVTDAPPRVRIGLATFDSKLRVLAPPGTPRDSLLAALHTIVARGQTTELYGSALDAIALLDKVQADRRALMIFSDGGAEDTAYHLGDVVQAARQAGVAIIGLGFAETPGRAAELQTLHRLAAETMGVYVSGGPGESLPASFLAAPFAGIENGARITVDLMPIASPFRALNRPLTVVLTRGSDVAKISLPINVHVPRRAFNWKEKVGAAGGIVILVLLGGLLLAWWRRKKPAVLPRPLARLDFLDSDGHADILTSTQVTIGRRDDNDIQLSNDTISEHHAVIRRQRNGVFEILDLGSTNGVEINGRTVQSAGLADGDMVTLGEVRFRFHRLQEPGS